MSSAMSLTTVRSHVLHSLEKTDPMTTGNVQQVRRFTHTDLTAPLLRPPARTLTVRPSGRLEKAKQWMSSGQETEVIGWALMECSHSTDPDSEEKQQMNAATE